MDPLKGALSLRTSRTFFRFAICLPFHIGREQSKHRRSGNRSTSQGSTCFLTHRSIASDTALLTAIVSMQMIARLGKEIQHEDSIYYWAWKNGIPVYSPALTDGSIGDMIYFHTYKRPGLVLDLVADIRAMNDEAIKAAPRKTGMIILGGGEHAKSLQADTSHEGSANTLKPQSHLELDCFLQRAMARVPSGTQNHKKSNTVVGMQPLAGSQKPAPWCCKSGQCCPAAETFCFRTK